ncbi:hypothetical protein [Bifidobacterium merycicum]|uniref:hypothetical protein n=1 Tax=Bifidobacterium merycicum TaxID=78345 RepID=UPI000A64DAF9|nr:hypothetical protein [Bifidobacterium merycicum]MBQ1513404.1 hypothetical protein [Bifidobacterium sp.]
MNGFFPVPLIESFPWRSDHCNPKSRGQRDVRRIYAEGRRAENWCLKFTSAVFSLLVVAVFIVTVVFWAMGMNAQAILSAACFVLCLLPRVIDAIKGHKTGDNMAPPSDGGDASAE